MRLDAAGFGHDARVGGVDAIDVGVNLAGIGPQHGGQGDGRRIAAAAAERGDVEIVVDALEAGGDDDVAVVEQLLHPLGGNRLDAGLGMRAVGLNADLRPGEADGLVPSEWIAIAIRATLTCSPVERSISISRAGGRSVIFAARSSRSSVCGPWR